MVPIGLSLFAIMGQRKFYSLFLCLFYVLRSNVNSGNIAGQQPYISGSSCSQCATDEPFCVNNACCKLKLLSS